MFWPLLGSPWKMGVPDSGQTLSPISYFLRILSPLENLQPSFSSHLLGEATKILQHVSLVGGWTNPFEKYARQIGSSPQVKGEHKNVWVATHQKHQNLCLHVVEAISTLWGGGLPQLPWGLTDGLSEVFLFLQVSFCTWAERRAIDDAILDDTVDGSEILHQLIW